MLSRLRAAAQTLASPPVLDFWARQFNPAWSVDAVRARLVGRRDASCDAVTLVLKPNRHWRGHTAGQHVNLTVEIDGRRYTRSYSPAASPRHPGCIEITVKRVAGGAVSPHLCHGMPLGGVVELGRPYGEMSVGGEPAPRLLLAAGSGITPMIAMLRELARAGVPAPVRLMYWTRTRAERCFEDELRGLALAHPNLEVRFVLTGETARDQDEIEGRIGVSLFGGLGLARRQVYACGPAGFVATARQLLAGTVRSFTAEAFSPPARETSGTGTVRVTLAKSGRTLEVARGTPLLAALEAQGESPRYGCRMGICNTCACEKRSGVTTQLHTGDTESEPVSALRLCVSGASSDLVLEL